MDVLTEEELELLDPAPDIHALFVHFNQLYFESKLGACSGAGRPCPRQERRSRRRSLPGLRLLASIPSLHTCPPTPAVEWSSKRMTACGGTCELVGGGAGGCRIKLSEPLLKVGAQGTAAGRLMGCRWQAPAVVLAAATRGSRCAGAPAVPAQPVPSPPPMQLRPSRDLKMVLLHEMTHAVRAGWALPGRLRGALRSAPVLLLL